MDQNHLHQQIGTTLAPEEFEQGIKAAQAQQAQTYGTYGGVLAGFPRICTCGAGAIGRAAIRPLKPTIGQIVHYRSHGSPDGKYKSETRAAIVTAICDEEDFKGDVSLCVLNPTGLFFIQRCSHSGSDQIAPGTWWRASLVI